MACVWLQEGGQVCLGLVVHFDPEPLGRWGGACHPRSHRGTLTATEIREKAGRVLCSRFGCCLHYGHDAALSTSWADPPSGPHIHTQSLQRRWKQPPLFYKSRDRYVWPPLGSLAVLPSPRALPNARWSGFNKQRLCSSDGNWRWMLQQSAARCDHREVVARTSGSFLSLLAHVSAVARLRFGLENAPCHSCACFWSRVRPGLPLF